MTHETLKLFDPTLVQPAIVEAFKKFDPRIQPTFRTTKATISHFGKRVSSEAGVAAVSNASGRE